MKKLLAILGMITCMIGLTACGASENTTTSLLDESQLIAYGEQSVTNIYQIATANAEGQYASDEVAYNGIMGFKSALEDIGNYLGTNGGTAEFNDDETIIRINVRGSDHDAVVEMVLDESLNFSSIVTNVTYSTGELMAKAGLNTLLGMGTVFVVLILISLIISLFGYIPKLFDSNKKAPEKAQAEVKDNVVAQIVENEEQSDDLELVAVISAAIAAYEGSGSTDGFVVRSIRKAYKK